MLVFRQALGRTSEGGDSAHRLSALRVAAGGFAGTRRVIARTHVPRHLVTSAHRRDSLNRRPARVIGCERQAVGRRRPLKVLVPAADSLSGAADCAAAAGAARGPRMANAMESMKQTTWTSRRWVGRTAVAVALALVLARPASRPADRGSEQPPDLSNLTLEELAGLDIDSVYGASMYLQKVSEAPSSVTIISADDIERYGYRTLADALRSVRGFYITNDRNYSYLGVRGFSRPGDYNARILLLIDGHRLNDNIFGSALLGTEFPLDIELIQRIEIIRGPSSSLYGTSAFFGVINVVTKRADSLKGLDVAGAAGTFASKRGRASYAQTFAQRRHPGALRDRRSPRTASGNCTSASSTARTPTTASPRTPTRTRPATCSAR